MKMGNKSTDPFQNGGKAWAKISLYFKIPIQNYCMFLMSHFSTGDCHNTSAKHILKYSEVH